MRRHKFKIFFVFLISFLIIEPLPTPVLDKLLGLILLLILTFSPYLMTWSRRSLVVSIIFVVIGFLSYCLPDSIPHSLLYPVKIIGLFMYFTIIAYVYWNVLKSEIVSEDLIFGSLCGYFLIGIGFGFAYAVLQDLGLAEFATAETTRTLLNEDELFYYSFSALTTLGIGDFVPANPIAMRLTNIESCFGVLYVAVFIGRMIGLYSGPKRRVANPVNKD